MINTLTSLRLIFAFMVFGAHCYVIDDIFSTHFFKEGFVGVSFFFVLSGFIIAYNYQKKTTGERDNQTEVLGGTHSPCLSSALADVVHCRNFGRLCGCIGGLGLVQAFSCFLDIDPCLYTWSWLLFFFQQSFVDLMLRAAVLHLLSFSCPVDPEL